MIILLLVGCLPVPGEVQLSGQILTAQDSGVGGPEIAVAAHDSELQPYSDTITDEDGLFSVLVQTSRVWHLVLTGVGVIPTAFSGVVGQADTAIPEDSLFVRSETEVEALRIAHSLCPTAQDAGGIVEGVVRFYLQNSQDESYLIAEESYVEVYDVDGQPYDVCYLDNDGESLEKGSAVGATGRFVAFGLPAGPITVAFKQDVSSQTIENYGFVMMPEYGIAPFHPAFIDLAG
jgi:hypothetical protein